MRPVDAITPDAFDGQIHITIGMQPPHRERTEKPHACSSKLAAKNLCNRREQGATGVGALLHVGLKPRLPGGEKGGGLRGSRAHAANIGKRAGRGKRMTGSAAIPALPPSEGSAAALPESAPGYTGRTMPRFFNTTGPCDSEWHFMLPPESRQPDIFSLVERRQYFVLHAARQTGKTTGMMAFAAGLCQRGYAAVWCTLEASQGVDDIERAELIWLAAVEMGARATLPPSCHPPASGDFAGRPVGTRLSAYLTAWCAGLPEVPVVLLLDEADVVSGPALVSLLRQLRAGFMLRGPGRFPVSVGLIGMRDLRDYLAAAKDGAAVNPGSPFNIKAESITLRNFNRAEVGELYAQHTAETGQAFESAAVDRAFWWTAGQPFLVNALAGICVDKLVPTRETPITAGHIEAAKEHLVLSRTTHLDSLGQRLRDQRVAAVISAVIAGEAAIPYHSDDYQYCIDLGLLANEHRDAKIACPLYREVIARELTIDAQGGMALPARTWLRTDGTLDAPVLVEAFRRWWRENADFAIGANAAGYQEALVHLTFMAFLQRVVNGGGRILREFAAGRGAVDLVVELGDRRTVIELKRVRPRDALDTIRADGIRQLSAYLDTLGEHEGWLLIFDQRPGRSWEERCWDETVEVEGRTLHLLGA